VLNQPNGTNVYLIWYGNWSGDTSKQILTDFIQYLGCSPAYNINTTYYDSTVGTLEIKVACVGNPSVELGLRELSGCRPRTPVHALVKPLAFP
jgi:hypothetical protein